MWWLTRRPVCLRLLPLQGALPLPPFNRDLRRSFVMHARYINALLVLLTFTSVVIGTANADPVVPVNQGIEAMSSDFVLPSSDAGNLFFNSCNGCKLNSLRVTAATRYLVGNSTVSLREVKQFLQKGGPYFVMIYRDLKEPIVTKIVVHAEFRPSLPK